MTKEEQEKQDAEFHLFLIRNGYTDIRRLKDGWVAILPQIGLFALCAGLDSSGYPRRYDYHGIKRCREEIKLMKSIHDEPTGWQRRLPERIFFTLGGYKERIIIGQCMPESHIIENACMQEKMDGVMEAEWPQTLEEAVAVLHAGERIFEVFDIETNGGDFLSRADSLGLQEEAGKLVASVAR